MNHSYAAKIVDGIVDNVIVVPEMDNDDDLQHYLASLNLEGNYVLTYFDGTLRGKYAAIGDTWDGSTFSSPVIVEDE